MVKTDKYKWHVIYTRSRHEKKLAATYREKGIEYYLPTVQTMKQWSDRKKKVEEVLFKSYIFVRVSEKEYIEALKTAGAVRYVAIEGKAVSLSEAQVQQIKNTVENNLDFDLSNASFKKGETVSIKNGPFKGTVGEFITWSGKKKLLIRVDEIGYSLLVHISPGDLI
jgi:transcriptional antiterminator RfaH